MTTECVDVLIIGAGLSGIGAACHLKSECPEHSFLILEGREAMGGTWDLFRYPGIRSDSDMHTLGYNFKPWLKAEAIADGPSILDYIRETASEYKLENQIRYRHRVTRLDWSSAEACWTATVDTGDAGERVILKSNFVMMCAGYYSYRGGHTPDFPGIDEFTGPVIHPQQWPEDLDYRDKRVVIIGSGATAVTLLPAMSEDAASVTMLQRSPTYMAAAPRKDRLANMLATLLPRSWAYAATRWKNVLLQQWVYRRTRVAPEKVRDVLLKRVRRELGEDYDVETHFTPGYKPWDQRLCLVPDSDFFEALRSGRGCVVTDHIERFTKHGILLKSGESLDADIVITATGLEMVVMGEIAVTVDGKPVDFAETWSYKGVMCSDVPNLVATFGYINASWTLRADLTAEFSCRVLKRMKYTGTSQVTPRLRPEDAGMPARDWIEHFSAGYMRRMMHRFPKQGDRAPWLNPQSYRKDRKLFRRDTLDDGTLVFSAPRPAADEPEESLFKAVS